MSKKFLTAEWNNLIMANYVIDPALLAPYLPVRTELDLYKGKCYVSLIGFMFEQTTVLGIRIPFHVNFEEVNLRFYVRFKEDGVWKRGAVFIKEIVPKRAISFVANNLYNEKYITLPMMHYYREEENRIELGYHWKYRGSWNKLEAITETDAIPMQQGSKEEFISEHYWGYSRFNARTTIEYGVAHVPWYIHPVKDYTIVCDFEKLYGPAFAFMNNNIPDSVFMAKGSPISIMSKRSINLT
ncbi:MAG: DUF2071 domain-containing protein [Ferruginibacter sp.]